MANEPALVPLINLSKLAREIAMDIFPLDTIQEAHKLSDEQWAGVMRDPQFSKMLGEMIVDWRSAAGTAERVKIKAQTAVEAALEEFFVELTNRDNPLSQRTEALKLLAKLGDLGEKDNIAATSGGQIHININLGNGEPPVTIDSQAIVVEQVTQ